MRKRQFVLIAVLFLVVCTSFGQPALPETDEGNVVLPIGRMLSAVALICMSYGIFKQKD